MNRKERRHMEKQLGLQKHYKTLKREELWEKMRGNIENGKRMQEEKKKEVEIMFKEKEDQIISGKITTRAEQIAKEKNIPLIDAMVEAQEESKKISK